MTDLDEIDRRILRALARDASQSASSLGRRFGLSQPATWRRIRRLEEGISNNPDSSKLSQELGWVYREKLGDPCKAAEAYFKAKDLPGSIRTAIIYYDEVEVGIV